MTGVDGPLSMAVPDTDRSAWLTFLAAPSRQLDWRLVLVYEATADLLVELPASLAALAERHDIDPTVLRAIFRFLASWDIAVVDGDRVEPGPLALDPVADLMVRRHATVLRRWSDALPGLVGRPAPVAPGAGTELDPLGMALLERHQRATMAALVPLLLEAIPEGGRVLDLGGGHGAHAKALAATGRNVVLQDLPSVIERYEQHNGELQRVEVFAADLREALPDGLFDFVLLSTVTNLFDETTNRDLLDRLVDRLAPNGAIGIATFLGDTGPIAAAFGVQMAVFSDGGDAHCGDQLRAWLGGAGLRRIEIESLGEPGQSLVCGWRE